MSTGHGGAVPDEPGIVWNRPERGARGPAPERSRAQLAAAAVRLADAGGLGAVSMRQVARELGTGPASLYRYVDGRDDLIDLMVDAVTAEIDLDVPLAGDPVGDLVALSARGKALHLRHPWLLDVPLERSRLGPNGIDYLEHALRALAPLPLDGRAKMEAIGLLNGLATLFARIEVDGRRTPSDRQAAQAAYLARVAGDGRHPQLAEAMAGAGAGPPEDLDALFERMARRVVQGFIG